MLESSIIAQSNQRLGMYLNVPIQCGSIYDEFIAQLEACKTGANLGNENISHGCLVQIALTDAQNECIYDQNGQVKRYDLPEEVPVFVPEAIRNSGLGLRPSRKDIVQFLLGLLEETDIPRYWNHLLHSGAVGMGSMGSAEPINL